MLDNSDKIGNNDNELRYNKNHDGKTGRFSSGKGVSGGGTANVDTKLDEYFDDEPFRKKSVKLSQKEYKNVVDEIGRYWVDKYQGKKICKVKFTNKTYYFENRGIGNYNVYKVKKEEK